MYKKIRVGFILDLTEEWLGGVNYYRSLLYAITQNKDLNIEPIVFISSNNEVFLTDFPEVETVSFKYPDKFSVKGFYYRALTRFLHANIFFERIISGKKIDVISHITSRNFLREVPSLGWIPDFQHIYLPEFFKKREIIERNMLFKEISNNVRGVILSSNDAKQDFIKMYPKQAEKAKVLQFVVPYKEIEDFDLSTYGIKGKFFYLPNQFWAHKNHKIVLEAINLANKKQGIKVVCTGNTTDYRNKKHFASLEKFIEDNRLQRNVILLGKVSYNIVQCLLKECIAVINPSLFEGWSTTVEEAKSIDKKIILSDIPVHREQAPEKGYFFAPNDAEKLCEIMSYIWNIENIEKLNNASELEIKSRERVRHFAKEYRKILESCINKK